MEKEVIVLVATRTLWFMTIIVWLFLALIISIEIAALIEKKIDWPP